MTPERYREIESVFEQALDLPAEERTAFLEEACGADDSLRHEVEALLVADAAAAGFIERPPRTEGAAALEKLAEMPDLGRRIGPYRLLRRIGFGGMGVVFLACRDDDAYEQRVAIKVVYPDLSRPDLLRRFRVERQILATLEHPMIARILDGGSTEDGQQYLVLEHVEGLPIDVYCQENRLSISERLRLMRQVCSAVHYAHRHLVVHRDIKPANVLVTREGVPKLLDFGIAKLLDPESFPGEIETTGTGLRLLTPAFASPEQVRGEAITTATDTFALGILLYRLLTGRLPFGGEGEPRREVEREVCEDDPAKPSDVIEGTQEIARASRAGAGSSTPSPEGVSQARQLRPEQLRRRLSGDLDRIVLKALRKEPERRYSSAEELAEDLRRHLEGLPVGARADTWSYRLGKFLRRHRAASALAALLFVSLAGFALTMALQASQIARQRDQVEAERDKAQRVVELLKEIFEVASPGGVEGETITARALLDQGMDRVTARLADQPELRAELLTTLGILYYNLALFERAETMFRQAITSQRGAHGDDLTVAETLAELANTRMSLGDFVGAEAILQESLSIKRKLLESDHPGIAWALVALGSARRGQGDHKDAERLYQEALEMQRLFSDEADPALIPFLYSVAIARQDRGDYDGAQAHYRQAYELHRRAFGEDHPDTLRYLGQIGTVLNAKGDYAAAEEIFIEAIGRQRRLLGDDHPDLAGMLVDYGSVLENRTEYDAAATLYHEASEIMRRSLGPDHPETVWSIYGLATLYERKGDLARAESYYREVLEAQRRILGDGHVELTLPLVGLGEVLRRRGDSAAAEPLLREALAIRRKALPAGSWRIASAEGALGRVLSQLGRFEEAEPLLVESHPVLARVRGPDHRVTQEALGGLIAHFEAVGDPARAEGYRALLTPTAADPEP